MATLWEVIAVATAHHQAGRLSAAEEICRAVLAVEPEHPEALHLLGIVTDRAGQPEAALGYIRRAIRADDTQATFHNSLGNVLMRQGRLPEAIASYRRALEVRPQAAEVHYNLGNALKEQGCTEWAIHHYLQALTLRPDFADAYCDLGTALVDQGRLDEPATCYQRALGLQPGLVRARSHYLYLLRYDPRVTAAAMLAAHREFECEHAAVLRSEWKPHENSPDPQRPLRLGFVSPVFCQGPVGAFTIGVVEHLDRAQCRVLFYSDRMQPDDLTQRFKDAADEWRETSCQSDE